ncbi:zinc transporter 10-like, partial [Myxocyprinus asiaticus]|uniref:zinc transporter 10-like n=1 Tax=Myxocyprinus asiaticus TaxID=70543 RepID=UPI002221EF8B
CDGASVLHSTLVHYPSAGRLSQQSTSPDHEEKSANDGPPLNIRGVLLHVLNDALGSVVVVVASALFYVWPLTPESPCNWQCYVDPSLTLIMVAIIMSSAVPLVKETAGILLQMSPVDLPFSTILENVCKLAGVTSVHEAHVWELAKGRNVASLHVKVSPDLHDPCWETSGLHRQILEVFHCAGVHSVTLQFECSEGEQDSGHCNTPCLSPACRKLSCCPGGATSVSVCHGNPSSPSGDVTVDMLDGSNTLLREKESKHASDKHTESTKF